VIIILVKVVNMILLNVSEDVYGKIRELGRSSEKLNTN